MRTTTSATAASGSGRNPAAILVVDDHDLLRLGVRALLHSQGEQPAIDLYEAPNLSVALSLYEAHRDRIGLVLLDLALPDTQGLSGLVMFRARFPEARIVVLSGTADASLAQGALALGAVAFLPKSADLAEVVGFIRGGAWHESAPGARQVAPTEMPRLRAGTWPQVTPRQAEILRWVLEGKTNREIAQLAGLSEGTVKNHVSTILLLFSVRSRSQLISTLR